MMRGEAGDTMQIRNPNTRWSYAIRNANAGHIHCAYCAVALRPSHITLDHVVAQDNGGTNDPSNIVVACANCNRAKGTKRLSIFVRELAAELAVGVANCIPSGSTDTEWEAAWTAATLDIEHTISLRIRRERTRSLDRCRPMGRVAARQAKLFKTAA